MKIKTGRCAHILHSAAAGGVVSHLTGAALKPFDLRKLEAWNWSNSVAKYIMLEVISDALERLMHHELAHTLFSHLAAIFSDRDPIAIEPPAERSNSLSERTQSRMALTQRAPQLWSNQQSQTSTGRLRWAERAYRVKLESRENGIGRVDSSLQMCQPNRRTQTAVTYCTHALEGRVGMQVTRSVLEAERTYRVARRMCREDGQMFRARQTTLKRPC